MTTAGRSPTTPLLRIRVPRRIEASPEEVFDAWAEPELFRRWFEPHGAILRKAADDELWYWEADHAGRLWSHYCRYLRVERPRLLEFAWMSEATRGLESRVTIEMTPSRGATDLVLTHSGSRTTRWAAATRRDGSSSSASWPRRSKGCGDEPGPRECFGTELRRVACRTIGGERTFAGVADVRDEKSVQAFFAAAERALGPVTIAVANAGIYPNCPVLDMT